MARFAAAARTYRLALLVGDPPFWASLRLPGLLPLVRDGDLFPVLWEVAL
jgi:hypothetical protein